MFIKADLAKCNGYANCMAVSSELFDLDEAGLVKILIESPTDDQREVAEEAVRACPAQAIWLEA